MRMVVRKLIERADDYALVGEAENGEELLALFEKARPEVVFMDVEMPGMSGVECARLIQDKNPKTIMVFVTAHEEYMADAFEVYAFDYLLKPFRLERAMHTLDLIRQRLRESAGAQDAPQNSIAQTGVLGKEPAGRKTARAGLWDSPTPGRGACRGMLQRRLPV